MPRRAPRLCNLAGCAAFSAPKQSYCDDHLVVRNRQKRASEKPRASARARGYTKAWERARESHLMDEPFCRECKKESGRLVEAKVVDHKVPHKGDKKLFWDRRNWQSLCTPHHNRKTAREDGGFGHAVRHRRAH